MIRLKVQVTSAGLIVNDQRALKKVMRAAGNEVAAVARALIRRQAGSGRLYGKHRASAAGEAPARITGALLRGIRVRPFKSGMGVSIRDTEFYAKFLEVGAKGGGGRKGSANLGARRKGAKRTAQTARVLAPHPFLSTALASREKSLAQRIKGAVDQDVQFQRIKP